MCLKDKRERESELLPSTLPFVHSFKKYMFIVCQEKVPVFMNLISAKGQVNRASVDQPIKK